VLVVEDEVTMREMLRRTLEKEGWAVSEAENGRVALECIAENRPGLILLDLIMPEMDGFQFMAELRKRETWRTIPVVVITAKDLTAKDRRRLDGYVKRILQKGAYSREALLAEGQVVAVKALKPEIVVGNPDLVARFVREGEALRQLNHPNIVTMVAAVEEDGRHYLVMEYVGGGSLRDLLEATRPDRFQENLSLKFCAKIGG